MDWTIFWTISWTMFWTIFWTILKGRSTPLVLREGWGGMKSISSEGVVGGSVLTQGGAREGLILRREEWRSGSCNNKHYWFMELLLDRTSYFNWFFD